MTCACAYAIHLVMPTMYIDSAPDFIREVDTDDEPTDFEYCGLASCGPGTECPDCLRAQGVGCVHSEVHAPGTEPYAVGRDSEGEASCESCLTNDKEGA